MSLAPADSGADQWLLLRGLAREQRHWHEFSRRLAERVGEGRVHLLDVAGSGTERERLTLPSVSWQARDIARRLPTTQACAPSRGWSLVGVSLGGMIALELCRQLPDRIARAVVINSSSRLTRAASRFRPLAGLELVLATRDEDLTRREEKILELTSTLPPSERSRYAALAARYAREAPMTRWNALSQLLAAARFRPPEPGTIDARLMFVCSRADALVSPECTRDLAAFYACPFEEHPSAGHDLALDDPEWLAERILSFAGQAVPG